MDIVAKQVEAKIEQAEKEAKERAEREAKARKEEADRKRREHEANNPPPRPAGMAPPVLPTVPAAGDPKPVNLATTAGFTWSAIREGAEDELQMHSQSTSEKDEADKKPEEKKPDEKKPEEK